MIMKEREKSLRLLKHEILLPRLHDENPKKNLIENNFKKYEAGYRGELAFEYPLSFIDEKRYYIFHDLKLSDGKHEFQLDTLILSRYFHAIVDIKNYAGELYFDLPLNQLIQKIGDAKKNLPNPVSQVKRHKKQFLKWLENKNLPKIPIETLAVIENDRAIINISHPSQDFYQTIRRGYDVPERIEAYERKYTKELLTQRELRKIIRKIFETQIHDNDNLLLRYGLSKEEIIMGVKCLKCKHIPMQRVHSKWICQNCNFSSRDAHLQTIKELSLLFNQQEVSNSDIKNWLAIDSRHTAKRILQTMKLKTKGKGRHTKYELDKLHIS